MTQRLALKRSNDKRFKFRKLKIFRVVTLIQFNEQVIRFLCNFVHRSKLELSISNPE